MKVFRKRRRCRLAPLLAYRCSLQPHGGRSAEAMAASRYVKMIASVLDDEFS